MRQLSKAKILVVEDEAEVSKVIQLTLEQLGYVVPSVTASGEDAIKLAEKLQPDLVLMDILLQGPMSGVRAAAQIRTRLDIPVIYLTALTEDRFVQHAHATEPSSCLLKPFTEKQLQEAIEENLAQNRARAKPKPSQPELVENRIGKDISYLSESCSETTTDSIK